MKALNPRVEYIVKNGKPTSVILPLEEYQELLENLHDLSCILQRKNEPVIFLSRKW